MRFRPFAAYALATNLLLAAASHCAASTTYQGGSWYSGSSWTGGTVPTLADDVIIPTGNSLTLTSPAYANTLTVQGNSSITIIDTTLEVDGDGNNPSSINSAAAIILDDDFSEPLIPILSVLKLSGTQTWIGAGRIKLDRLDTLIELSNGVTWTFGANSIYGYGEIDATAGGTATLKLDNGADLIADFDGTTLELGNSLSLDDTSTNNVWMAETGGELVFNHSATHLVGTIINEQSGTLRFNADVTTTGLFTFNGITGQEAVLIVADGVDYVYGSYSSDDSCGNPGSGSGGGPFTVSGPVTEVCP
jgi:hypothetical protein